MKYLHKRYFSFHGETSRKQYWSRTLAFLIGSTPLIVLFVKASLGGWEVLLGIAWFGTWLWILFATSIRRCRDVGINPHWLWLWLLPGAGNIFYIALGCLKSDDGVRIARPTPKEGLVRYLSVFGYATRQEYWCIVIPITLAITITTSISVILFAYLASLFDFFIIFESAALAAYFIVPVWLTTAACVRRCRDAALNPWWSLLVVPSWRFGLPVSGFIFIRSSESLSWMSGKSMQLLMLNHDMDDKFLILSFLLLVPYIVFGCLTSKEKT